MNVILKDVRKTVELSLPSFPESKVVLYDGLLFGQIKKIVEAKEDMDRGILVLQYLIKEWNFTDEKGNTLEINETTLSQFPLKDLTILMERANKILEDISKKKLESSKK